MFNLLYRVIVLNYYILYNNGILYHGNCPLPCPHQLKQFDLIQLNQKPSSTFHEIRHHFLVTACDISVSHIMYYFTTRTTLQHDHDFFARQHDYITRLPEKKL